MWITQINHIRFIQIPITEHRDFIKVSLQVSKLEIKIFVVETEIQKLNVTIAQRQDRIKAYDTLFRLKTDLIKLFGGLTELKDCRGYWLNSQGLIESDKVNYWLIYTTKEHLKQGFNVEKALIGILMQIQALTKQKTQAYTIDNEIFFL